MMKDLLACQEATRDWFLAWFTKFHDNVVENLWSKDHLIYHEEKERILNLPSNHWSLSGPLSNDSKPQPEAILILRPMVIIMRRSRKGRAPLQLA
jgi:hypothetical protein